MASLISLQGSGGGRIPMGGFSYVVSRTQLAEIIGAMPIDTSHMLRDATRAGDTVTAQRLIREAAAAYFTTTPAAPLCHPPAPHHSRRRVDNTPTNRV
jgi:hypothetical protein